MALQFTVRDGQRVTLWMLYQLNRLDAALFAVFGVHIIVSSGLRTYAEQEAIFRARYVTAGNINGRKVYDTRVWNGVTWYRISSAGTVAVPGTSNHEVQGSSGAVDIHDTGSDAGITVKGSKRGQWIRQHCGEFDMVAEGDGFGEGWHFKMLYIDKIPSNGGGGGGSIDTNAKQNFLNSLGYSTGTPGWGPMCAAATKDFQGSVGLTADGEFGPKTEAIAQIISSGEKQVTRATSEIERFLQGRGLYSGTIDESWGNKCSWGTYRFQGQAGLTQDSKWGPNTDAKAFPVVTPPPIITPPVTVPGRNATKRPLTDIQNFLKVPATNVWDQTTANAVKNFQASKFIDQDYVWGNASDGFVFPPTGMKLFGCDYSFARVPLETLLARGVKFTPRYLWNLLQSNGSPNKGLSRAEHDERVNAGIAVPFIYEQDGKELLGGSLMGAKIAQDAEGHRNREGLPAKPIYFNVDFAADPSQYATILAALDAIAGEIGFDRVGLYGGYGIIKAAFDAGKIKYGMQTYGWSVSNGVVQWDPRAQLRQWANGQWGNTVDFQYAMADDFGQNAVDVPADNKLIIDRATAETNLEIQKAIVNRLETSLSDSKSQQAYWEGMLNG